MESSQQNINTGYSLLFKIALGDTFSTLMQQFNKALVQHYSKGGKHFYDPNEIEKFCSVNAPCLFDDIFIAIYNKDKETTSNKRTNLQRIQVVAILHNLSFFSFFRYGYCFSSCIKIEQEEFRIIIDIHWIQSTLS